AREGWQLLIAGAPAILLRSPSAQAGKRLLPRRAASSRPMRTTAERSPSIRAALASALATALLLALAGCGGGGSGAGSGSSRGAGGPVEGIHKIKHVIVIMQENRSFDSYFGTYPGA